MEDIKDAALVIGDWVIDEYWFLVQHHSDISSHTGYSHYRISNKPGTFVRDLCGAGNIARSLHSIKGRKYELYGLGIWDERDSTVIQHLIHADQENKCAVNDVGVGLSIDKCGQDPKVKITTICTEGPTTRVIRTYHQEGSGYEQLNRIDWAPGNESPSEPIDKKKLTENLPADLKAIIVYDLNKGTISDKLVDILHETYPTAKWYVRTKNKNAQWLYKILTNLEIAFLGPEVTALLNPWGTWLVNGRAKQLALHHLEKMKGRINILVSSVREVIIKDRDDNIIISNSLTGKESVRLGWSSTLFSVIVHELINNSGEISYESLLKRSIEMADQKDMLVIPNAIVSKTPKQIIVRDPETKKFGEEKSIWKRSRSITDLGCVSKDDGQYLEVWRGSPYLPGYISCIREKDDILCRIGSQLNSFNNGSQSARSLSVLLQADPGSGKTHLAKTLAKTFKYSFLRFDITQMIHKDEILDLFDSIATQQANTRTKLFVFVDEINALLENQHIYSSFLAPLEEGYYSRRGRQFILKPCVWLFAGTKMKDALTSEKLSDFESRMTLIEKIDYESLVKPYTDKIDDIQRIEKHAQLEQVYLGATMIKRFFPDVNEIGIDVLKQFSVLSPKEQPARKIRRMAETLRNVQHGKITRRNCDNWMIKENDWMNDQTMIKLSF